MLGSGTSVGVPMIGCRCAVCHSQDPRDQRLRPSVHVKYGDRGVLIDTTPDFRYQALRSEIERVDAILFTHSHADHVDGPGRRAAVQLPAGRRDSDLRVGGND